MCSRVVGRVEGGALGWLLARREDGFVVVDCHCHKVLLHPEELRDLAEFAVAAVVAVEVAVHRDDPFGSRS